MKAKDYLGLTLWPVLFLAVCRPALADSESAYGLTVRYNHMVAMRDGVRLSTDVYRPDATGRFPVVLVRDPYDNGSGRGHPGRGKFWASRGYVFLHQDVRGRSDSEGGFFPSLNEGLDGYDTVRWAATQPWSTGAVAMIGGSYLGTVQWRAAAAGSPDLKAIAPFFCGIDVYKDAYPGGALELGRIGWAAGMEGRTPQLFPREWARVIWHLPLLTMDEVLGQHLPLWKGLIRHPSAGSYWEPLGDSERIEQTQVAPLILGGWYDPFLPAVLEAFQKSASRKVKGKVLHQKLVVGPWRHGGTNQRKTGEIDFGDDAVVDENELALRWFDCHLKGECNGVVDEPRVELFVMGANRWRKAQQWPLPEIQFTRFYFHSQGKASLLEGDGSLTRGRPGTEPADRYAYDPANPVPTRGGSLPGINTGVSPGPVDQREVEARSDVLTYTSPVLERNLEVTGPLWVTLYAASTARDTDFTAKLIDVYPDGRAINLNEGIIRARYRESRASPELLEPGRIYRYEIDLVATSNLFRKGHRIRVEISSSNFPRFDRNPNTGNPFGLDDKLETALQTIYHDRDHPSHVVLPIIPD